MALNLNNYKRISGLTEKVNLDSDDVFAIDNANSVASQKVSYGSLRSLLKTYMKIGTSAAGHYIEGDTIADDLGLLDAALYSQSGLIDEVLADLAPVQTGLVASQAYIAGSYLVYQNQLYLVTADITQGGTIVIGTNVTATTVGSALINAVINLAEAYNSAASYTVGDVVTHVGNLYVCTDDTSGAWNSAKWDNVTVADLISAFTSELSDLSDAVDAVATAVDGIGFHNMIKITLPGITSLPKTFNVTGMTVDHESIQDGCGLIEPSSSMGGDWTLVPGNGTLQVTGTFSGSTSTTIKVTMGIPDNKVTGVAQ